MVSVSVVGCESVVVFSACRSDWVSPRLSVIVAACLTVYSKIPTYLVILCIETIVAIVCNHYAHFMY